MNFNQLVESLLLEMPWLDFEANGKQFIIDLEMEKYLMNQNEQKHYSWERLFSVLVTILDGKQYTDKRGDQILLSTPEEKNAFIKSLNKDMIFDSYKRRFPVNTIVPEQLKALFN
jgi:hypothetical protein